jgi:hypothetical protein
MLIVGVGVKPNWTGGGGGAAYTSTVREPGRQLDIPFPEISQDTQVFRALFAFPSQS